MTEAERGWLAGILDGEGTVSIRKCLRRGYLFYQAEASVTNTNRMIVDRCRSICGFGFVLGPLKVSKGRSKDFYRWVVRGSHVDRLAWLAAPLLVTKREHLYFAILLRSLLRRGARHGEIGRRPDSPEELAQKDQLKLAVQCLNHRGTGSPSDEQVSALEAVRSAVRGAVR